MIAEFTVEFRQAAGGVAGQGDRSTWWKLNL